VGVGGFDLRHSSYESTTLQIQLRSFVFSSINLCRESSSQDHRIGVSSKAALDCCSSLSVTLRIFNITLREAVGAWTSLNELFFIAGGPFFNAFSAKDVLETSRC
jgi:hypothetical protein